MVGILYASVSGYTAPLKPSHLHMMRSIWSLTRLSSAVFSVKLWDETTNSWSLPSRAHDAVCAEYTFTV